MTFNEFNPRKALCTISFAFALSLCLQAHAQETINESREASPDGRISFSAVTGDFEVIGHDENSVRLEGELGEDVEELTIEGSPDNWTIKLEAANGSWFDNQSSSDLILYVPVSSQVKVNVVSAELELSNLNGERVEAESVSGDVSLTNVKPQRLTAKSVSGDVFVEGGGQVDSDIYSVSGDLDASELRGRIKAQSVSGDISIEAYEVSDFEAETVSGDITLDMTTLEQAMIEINAHSGDIELTLPAGTQMDLDASTFSGDIMNEFGGKVVDGSGPGESMEYTEGSGGVRINAQTFSGEISIERM